MPVRVPSIDTTGALLGATGDWVRGLAQSVAPKSIDATTNLNDVTMSGFYAQVNSSNASLEKNYPVALGGTLQVLNAGSGVVYQIYTLREGEVWTRNFYVDAWRPWAKVGTPPATSPALGTGDLDEVKAQGTYVQTADANVTDARHYPPITSTYKSGVLNVVVGGGITNQVYTASRGGEVWTRNFYIDTWRPWAKVGGTGTGSGTTFDDTQLRTDMAARDAQTLTDAKAYADTVAGGGGATAADVNAALLSAQNYAAAGDQDLQGQIDAHDTRLSAVEALGGLEPGDTSDAAVASHLADRQSMSRAAFDAAVLDSVVDPTTEVGSYVDSTYMRVDRAHEIFVTSSDVRRIITDPNARMTLQPGDFLLSPPTVEKRTTFYGTAVGQAPGKWTPLWGTAPWTVEADTDALSGKALKVTGTGTNLQMLTWDVLGAAVRDVELLARWRVTDLKALPRFVFHAGGDFATRNGQEIYLAASGQINWWTRNAGVSGGGTGANPLGAPIVGTWYRVRARIYNNTIYFKAWADTAVEPGNWQASPSRPTVLAPGRVGIGSAGPGTLEVDWVTASLDGGIAPEMEA
ncbi:pyocin knob domain-containing protein [Kocuria sp. MNB10]